MSGSNVSCDTSVLLPALMPMHESFSICREAVSEVAALPVHVLLETFRVLTVLPGGERVPPKLAAFTLAQLPWEPLQLPADEHLAFILRLGEAGIGGGPSYDALIAQTAKYHGCRLLTRDYRAQATYEHVVVDYTFVA